MADQKIFFIFNKDIIVHHADFLKLNLKSKVDLIITSPPYNIGIDYGTYNDNKTYKEYLEFSKSWLSKCFNLLRDNGRICINVPLSGKGRSLAADLTILAKRAGFKYKGTIIWNKQTGKDKYAMVFSKNIEVILILYKDEWVPVAKEYKDWVNEIWNFSGESTKRAGHPAPFPVELPRRLIKMLALRSSDRSGVVLDPFLGSGTTLIACQLSRIRGIGVEISKEYFEVAKKRIEERKW